MRILFLTPALPLPADQGAKLRNSALIRLAAAHHQVDLISFSHQSPSEPSITQLREYCQRIELVPSPPVRPLWRRAWDLMFGQLPDLARRLESPAFGTALAELLDGQRYDVVQIEGLEMIGYLPIVRSLAPRAGVIYDAHNAEMALQRSMFQVEFRNPARWHLGLYSFVQWCKLGTYERIMMNDTDMVLCVSQLDAAKLRGRHVEPQIVPNGVDLESVPYRAPTDKPGRVAFFVGPMDYRPNADGLRWLMSDVLPKVRATVPDLQVRLAGRGTERLRGNGVEGLGYVDDVEAELARAGAFVVPLRMGGGTRFKVLGAMAAGVPVVSTPLGMSGIAAVAGQQALVASSASEFASAIEHVLSNSSLAQKLARSARALVESQYAWAKIGPNYLRLLSQARQIGRRGS